MQTLVIYHGNCNDGFCAAWVVHRLWTNAEFVPAQYGQEPPDVAGKEVLIVDFSYPRDVLLKMRERATGFRVLDHHKTAEADLRGLDFCTFDMERSGAGLAWDYLHGGDPNNLFRNPLRERPWIVEAVQDRDLWLWKYPASRELNASITTWPRDFAYWDEQFETLDSIDEVQKVIERGDKIEIKADGRVIGPNQQRAIEEGRAILRYIDQYTDEMVAQARLVEFEGYCVPCVNVPYKGISEIVGKLAESAPFAMGWSQGKSGKFLYSLRSRGDFDVSAIAKKYGGGGHKNSAGFNSDKLLVP